MKDVGDACLAFALTALASSACAVTASGAAGARCEVVSGEKLLTASGGSGAICAAIERAMEHRGLAPRFTVRVRIERPSMFWAEVTLADGRILPAVEMAEMDRPISKATLDSFGRAVADHVAGQLR